MQPVSTKHDYWNGFDFYCEPLKRAKRQVVDYFNEDMDRGKAMVLAGPPGTGKTHLASVMMAGYGAPHLTFMIGEPDMTANLRATYDGDGTERMIISQYRRSHLFILDDLGTAYVKNLEWIQDIYWRILDRRSEMHLPVIITTNLRMAEMAERLGGRAYSRLRGMMSEDHYVDLFGVEDYRVR